MTHICVKDKSAHFDSTFGSTYIQVEDGYELFKLSKASSSSALLWPAHYYLSQSPSQCTVKRRTLLQILHFLLCEYERWQASWRL